MATELKASLAVKPINGEVSLASVTLAEEGKMSQQRDFIVTDSQLAFLRTLVEHVR